MAAKPKTIAKRSPIDQSRASIGGIRRWSRLRLFELARVLVRVDHITRFIANPITASCERL